MRPILENTQWELLLISPYFVPARDELALFEKLRKRGVRIRIITNSLASNDVAIVHSGYSTVSRGTPGIGSGIVRIQTDGSH